MTLDKQRLRELAEKATPGEWRELARCDNAGDDDACGIACDFIPPGYRYAPNIVASDAYDECSHPMRRADAAFIAAANPTAVLELLEENERLQAVVRGKTFSGETPFVVEQERDALRAQLAAMTAARDEACDWLHRLSGSAGDDEDIAALRTVGKVIP